jgi:hypothetical protein
MIIKVLFVCLCGENNNTLNSMSKLMEEFLLYNSIEPINVQGEGVAQIFAEIPWAQCFFGLNCQGDPLFWVLFYCTFINKFLKICRGSLFTPFMCIYEVYNKYFLFHTIKKVNDLKIIFNIFFIVSGCLEQKRLGTGS